MSLTNYRILISIVSIFVFIERGIGFVMHDAVLEQLRGGARAEPEEQTSRADIGRGPLEPVRPFVSSLLEGRRAVVTGGNRGIGEAITVALVEAGAKVCVMAGDEQ